MIVSFDGFIIEGLLTLTLWIFNCLRDYRMHTVVAVFVLQIFPAVILMFRVTYFVFIQSLELPAKTHAERVHSVRCFLAGEELVFVAETDGQSLTHGALDS